MTNFARSPWLVPLESFLKAERPVVFDYCPSKISPACYGRASKKRRFWRKIYCPIVLCRRGCCGNHFVCSRPGRAAGQGDPCCRWATAAPSNFGDLTADLVYTPVAPCRIADTRATTAGAISANSFRSFVTTNSTSYTSQGGLNTNCGTLFLSPTVVMIVATAVKPTAAGSATVYSFGTAQPTATSLQFAAGAIAVNTLAVQIPNPLSSYDFTVYTTAQAHFVFDIVGYFAPPIATALQCVPTANSELSVASGGLGNVTAPACPAGYTETGTNCEATSWFMPIVSSKTGNCSARNGDTVSATLRASRTCCRVPGR